MATLEKIRSKSVILLVIIGVALLAFILGDFISSGRTFFGTGTTIAKVGGQKIDVQDFQRRLQEASQNMQGQKYDSAVLQQQVLDAMITEALFNEEADKLGLAVSDGELRSIMVGPNAGYVNSRVQQEVGIESAAQLHDMVMNPQKYGLDANQLPQLKDYWAKLQQDVEKMLLQQKFSNLFMGTMVANNLDLKALYDETATTSNIAYTKKDYSTLDDSKFPVSADDIKARYDKERNRYKLDQENRSISYISANIVPSAADEKASAQKVDEALKALQTQPETTGLVEMEEFLIDRQKQTPHMLAERPNMKQFLDSAKIGDAAILAHHPQQYQLIKLLGISQGIDQATVDFIAIQAKKTTIDSLVAKLNAGASFDSIAALPIVAGQQKDFEVSLVDPNYSSIKEIVETAEVGRFFAPDTTSEGGRIFRISKRDEPGVIYDIAAVTYDVRPSAATVNKLQSDMQTFLNRNTTADAFYKNAKKAGYNPAQQLISNSTAQVGILNESHAGIAWAMDADKGQVSPIFGDEQSGRFFAVALNDIYDEGYLPVRNTDVTNDLTQKIRNDRKAEALIKQYQGKAKDINGYAQIMGSTVDSAAVVFAEPMIGGLGAESELVGRIVNTKAGQLVGPVKGANGVVVYYVVNVDKEGRPFNAEESNARYEQLRGGQRLSQNFPRILIGNKEIENNINKFYK